MEAAGQEAAIFAVAVHLLLDQCTHCFARALTPSLVRGMGHCTF